MVDKLCLVVHKQNMPKLISPNRVNEQYVTVRMAAKALNVTPERVHQMISEGKIEGFSIVDKVCVARRDVLKLARSRKRSGS
jgi:hypothetical protein